MFSTSGALHCSVTSFYIPFIFPHLEYPGETPAARAGKITMAATIL